MRGLAAELNCGLVTVSQAYDVLVARGRALTRVGKGTLTMAKCRAERAFRAALGARDRQPLAGAHGGRAGPAGASDRAGGDLAGDGTPRAGDVPAGRVRPRRAANARRRSARDYAVRLRDA